MNFDTKIAIVVAGDLAMWQKLNVVAFMTSGVMGATENIMGEPYVDKSGQTYNALCIQPMVVLKADRAKLPTFLARAERRGVNAAIYIEDMFATGHDAAIVRRSKRMIRPIYPSSASPSAPNAKS